jgi:hypothetical protein
VRLGVQGHVCELQLTLDSFDQILVMSFVVEPASPCCRDRSRLLCAPQQAHHSLEILYQLVSNVSNLMSRCSFSDTVNRNPRDAALIALCHWI